MSPGPITIKVQTKYAWPGRAILALAYLVRRLSLRATMWMVGHTSRWLWIRIDKGEWRRWRSYDQETSP